MRKAYKRPTVRDLEGLELERARAAFVRSSTSWVGAAIVIAIVLAGVALLLFDWWRRGYAGI